MRDAAATPGLSNRLRLAELMAMRLCHDLAGTVGTVSGALDVAMEDPGFAAEANSLARAAADTLVARLRLLRAAWSGHGAALDCPAILALASGLSATGVTVSVEGVRGAGRFSPAAGRLVLNVLMLAAESLPGGGVVALVGEMDGELAVRLDGKHAAWPAGLAGWLADEARAWAALEAPRSSAGAPDAAAARRLQGPLTALIAHAEGLDIAMPIGAAAASGPPPLVLRLAREN
jgi:histidine phosphotransferase ChpT